MKKIVRVNESDFVKIVKNIIFENESDSSFPDMGKQDNKKIKELKIALKYLTKKFGGNTISKEEYINALKKLNFIDFSRSEMIFNFFNQHVSKDFNWDDSSLNYTKLISSKELVKDGFMSFLDMKLDINDIELDGRTEEEAEEGNNNHTLYVDLSYEFMGETYYTDFEVNGSFYYTQEQDTYDTPGSDIVEEEEIDVDFTELLITDGEGNEYIIDMNKSMRNKLEYILLINYSPLEGSIELISYR
jgi:hypothetical protein